MGFRFKNFKVYQDAKDFCKFCREILDKQITDKDLAGQIRRALNSVVLNIAEGSAGDWPDSVAGANRGKPAAAATPCACKLGPEDTAWPGARGRAWGRCPASGRPPNAPPA